MHEKPIIADHSHWLEKVLKRQRASEVENPYESNRHKDACDYLDKHGLRIKSVRCDPGESSD